jgi:hypothetical protein
MADLPYGSHFEDGVRVGPFPTDQYSNVAIPNSATGTVSFPAGVYPGVDTLAVTFTGGSLPGASADLILPATFQAGHYLAIQYTASPTSGIQPIGYIEMPTAYADIAGTTQALTFVNPPVVNYNDPYALGRTASYSQFGPGIPLSPLFSYYLNPLPPIAGEIVAVNTVSGSGYLTLSGGSSNSPAQSFTPAQSSNQPPTASLTAIQLDFPRALSITIANGPTPATNVYVTVFGTDYYGCSMQESFLLNDNSSNTYQMNKAFYQIYNIYVSGTLGAATISIQTSNVFGLPYRIFAPGEGLALAVTTYDPTAATGSLAFTSIAGPAVEIIPGWAPVIGQLVPTAMSGDVRGTIEPANLPEQDRNYVFSYYARGFDTTLNQLFQAKSNPPANAYNYPSNLRSPIPPNYVTVTDGNGNITNNAAPVIAYGFSSTNSTNTSVYPFNQPSPLNSDDMYGFPQFYTGVPQTAP